MEILPALLSAEAVIASVLCFPRILFRCKRIAGTLEIHTYLIKIFISIKFLQLRCISIETESVYSQRLMRSPPVKFTILKILKKFFFHLYEKIHYKLEVVKLNLLRRVRVHKNKIINGIWLSNGQK